MNSVRVCIIEDDELIRDSYAFLIEKKSTHKIIGMYVDYEEAEKDLYELHPDVILLDIELPGKNGIDAIPSIKKILPDTFIIILSVFETEDLILKALRNGASGYLTKNSPSEKIISAIEEVMEGGGPMSSSVASLVIKAFQKNNNSPLSKREIEILENFAAGKSRKRIAEEMFIDTETVKTHLRNIYFKLDVHSKADAIQIARSKKFI
ncbi:MAG: two component transcriptional regulator, LuxR family [Chitinophagaceae bacterium]|nr:two component transcriptional regulator, LuxR family [Chitinophagaceae bacterium]